MHRTPLITGLCLALYTSALACSRGNGGAPIDAIDGGSDTDTAALDGGTEADASLLCPREDLYPHFDFSTDDGSFSDAGNVCNHPDGGSGPGDGTLTPPGAPTDSGGPLDPAGPPPGLDAGLAIRPVTLGLVANDFGTQADQIMPDVQVHGEVASLDDFAMDRPLGTNGRHCETCHSALGGWSSSPAAFRDRFENGVYYLTSVCPQRAKSNDMATRNDEMEPIFRTRDGTNSPLADVSTPAARRAAYSMLLTKGVLRIGLPAPTAEADFELIGVDDPYGFASVSELSLFRRSPLMANLRFNTTVMWDGRETLPCATLTDSLRDQAKGAVTGHAQGAVPSEEAVARIVRGELGIYTAQFIHVDAGPLHQDGAHGGPTFLAQVPFYWGINAFDKSDPQGHAYDKNVFTLYEAWSALPEDSARNAARRRIARGERLFNTRELTVRGVSGFNDELGRAEITATCGSCHNAPNVGTNSEGRLMDIGVSDEAQRTADLPLYTFREKATGATKKSSDPGQALITKKWAHIGRFKVPILRSLSVRPPYMHNGSAATLAAVVDYHDQRFDMRLTPEEKADLVAFLSAL